jgi:DNA-binding CsgD family transcriptional regulator
MTDGHKPWWALLPDETHYRDTGCDLSPSCLQCPLPRCVEDQPRGRQRHKMRAKGHIASTLAAQGLSQQEIARRLNVSARTIRRYINSHKRGGKNGTRNQSRNSTPSPPKRPPRLGHRTRRIAQRRRRPTASYQPAAAHPHRHHIRLLRRRVGRSPRCRRLAPDPICFPKKNTGYRTPAPLR